METTEVSVVMAKSANSPLQGFYNEPMKQSPTT